MGGVTTFYVGKHYEVEGGVVKKYYYAGDRRIAMRSGGALYPLLGDHLGSTAYTLSAASEFGEVRYKAFGATRFTSGTTPTTYRRVPPGRGQREESALGLYYYGARWYDPALGHFIQPDTLVPEPGNVLDYHRYGYARFNSLKYTDPSGHQVECPEQYQAKCGNGGGAMGAPPSGGGGGRIGGPGPNNGGGGFWNRLASPFRAAGKWVKSLLGGGDETPEPQPQMATPIQRAQNLLDGEPGYNVSPESYFKPASEGGYEYIGKERTFVTDKQAISNVIGEFEGQGSVVTISVTQAAQLETELGLQSGSLKQGFRISRVENIASRGPASPISGNQLFLGGGQGLPGGGPELTIERIPTQGGSGITQLTVNVVEEIR